ncbi:MAG: hypothetical protein R3C19_18865 [Planctomycetaceae bacterium]
MPNSFLGMHTADWLVLGGYFLLILIIGLWSSRKVHDVADFFMGGRRFGKVFMMFFAFGSGTSSEQAISVVAGTWRAGLAGIWWQFLWLPATPFYWIIAPMLRRIRALTTADFFQARFSPGTAVLYSVYGIIISIVFIAGALYSSGKMINALTGNALDEMAARINIEVPVFKLERVPVPGAAPPAAADPAVDPAVDGAAADVPAVTTLQPRIEWRLLAGYEYAILAMTVLFVTYGMAGGLGAAIITDFIQGVLTIAFSILLLPFVFHEIGGFGALHQTAGLKKGMFDFVATLDVAKELGQEPITLFYVFTLSATALAGIIVQPHIMGVCGAGKTEFEGRFGFTFGNFLKRLCTVAWTFTGLACIAWYLGSSSPLLTSGNPEEAALHAALTERAAGNLDALPPERINELKTIDKDFADQLFGRAAYDILPRVSPGLIGLLMASLLAAVMSTSDAQMVVSSGLFTENIYRRYLVTTRSERHYVWVGRLAGLVIVAMALILQATFTDVIHALQIIIKTPAAIGVSMWFGIVWKRWNTMAVWLSTLAAALTWVLVVWYPQTIASVLPDAARDSVFRMTESGLVMTDAWVNMSYLSAGIIVGVIVSLLTPQQTDEQLERFFTLLRTPVRADEADAAPCVVPYNNDVREPVIQFSGFQFPRPTLLGAGGFIAAWILVFAIIQMTKWLSTVV